MLQLACRSQPGPSHLSRCWHLPLGTCKQLGQQDSWLWAVTSLDDRLSEQGIWQAQSLLAQVHPCQQVR